MYSTSNSTPRVIQDIHITQGHMQPPIIKELLVESGRWQPEYGDLLKKVVNDCKECRPKRRRTSHTQGSSRVKYFGFGHKYLCRAYNVGRVVE